MAKEFEDWWVEQDTMFGNTVNVMYAFCEETGYDFNELHYEYYNEDVDRP
jgi:hypothetical protein